MSLDWLPGLHHAGRGRWWFMVGRAIPAPFDWWSVPPAASQSFVWGEGGCRISDARGTVELRAGEALYLGAGWPHEGRGHTGSDFLTVFRWGEIGAGRAVSPLDPALAGAAIRAAAAVLSGADPSPADALPLARAVALGGRDDVGPRGNLRRAKALLDERYQEGVDLDVLSDRAGLSRSEFVRQFKSAFGLTPIQYRKQRRLVDATELLHGGASVTRAALESGFADAAHLTRTFREQYGVPPSAWQRQVGSGSTPSGPARGRDRSRRGPGTRRDRGE